MTRWGLTLPLADAARCRTTTISSAGPRPRATRTSGRGETNGPDGFTPLALAAAWTEEIRLGTGVVGVFQRGPALLAQQAAALADASGGRFVLGIGASSDRIVEGWNGIPFERPLSKVDETVDFLRPALAGDRTANGFKLEAAPPEVPIVLAALRGKMLRLAVEKADGAFTNFLPISGLRRVVGELGGRARTASSSSAGSSACPASASRSSRSPGSCSPPTSPCRSTRPSTAGSATATRSPRCARPGRPRTARPRPPRRPWELIEEMFILGTPDEMRARLDEFVAGGITLPGADRRSARPTARAS